MTTAPIAHRHTTLARWLFAILLGSCLPGFAATPWKIVTASERGTYVRIGQDLAKYVAPDAAVDLDVLPSVGSAENVQRLRREPDVRPAMVRSDVYQAFVDQAQGGSPRPARSSNRCASSCLSTTKRSTSSSGRTRR